MRRSLLAFCGFVLFFSTLAVRTETIAAMPGMLTQPGRFKNERVHGIRDATLADMKAASFEYIEVFYNRKRQHSTLGYKSPKQFVAAWLSRQHQEKLLA